MTPARSRLYATSKSHLALAVSLFSFSPAVAGDLPFGPDIDIVSKPWMEAAKTFAECGASAAMASGDTSFLEGFGYVEPGGAVAKVIKENARLYMLGFDLGESFSEADFRAQVARIASVLEVMHAREAREAMPVAHAKLLKERRAMAFGFGLGSTRYATSMMIMEELGDCARLADEWLSGSVPRVFTDAK